MPINNYKVSLSENAWSRVKADTEESLKEKNKYLKTHTKTIWKRKDKVSQITLANSGCIVCKMEFRNFRGRNTGWDKTSHFWNQ